MRLDQNTPDSSCEEQCLKIVENEVIEPLDTKMPTAVDVIDSTELPNEDVPQEKFTKSGIITITDDIITLDISNSTGLRKTGFSEQIYSDNSCNNKNKSPMSKIPRSPLPVRRRSVENLCMTEIETGLPLSRKIPQYRSVRKPTAASMAKEIPKENTWSGRTTKRRPSLQNDTYQQSNSKPNSPSPNRKVMSNANRPPAQYDQNGRRIKPISASANTSPIKNRIASPLAQQFLEVAGEAKDDAQFLAKMKALLEQYTKKSANNKYSNDFTTAWVNGNGSVDHNDSGHNTSSSTTPPKKASTESSSEVSPPKEILTTGSTKRIGGLSRIPAPVRSNTGIY